MKHISPGCAILVKLRLCGLRGPPSPGFTPLTPQVTPLHSGVTVLHSVLFTPLPSSPPYKSALYANVVPGNTNIVPGTQAGLGYSMMARVVHFATPWHATTMPQEHR